MLIAYGAASSIEISDLYQEMKTADQHLMLVSKGAASVIRESGLKSQKQAS